MDTPSPLKKYWFYLIPVIVGFALRVWDLSLVQFGIDEGISAALCTQISHFRHFPLTGLETSFGFHNPPTTFYLFSPCFLFSSDPRVPSLVVALLGTTAIGLVARVVWLLSHRQSSACIAAWVMALCPNAIEHSRRFWGVDTTIFWSSVSVLCAIQALQKKDWRYLALAFMAAAVSQTMHLSGALLWAFPLVILFSRKIHRGIYALATGIAFAFLLYIPWIISESRSGFQEIGHVLAILSEGAPHKDLGLPVHPLGCWVTILADFWNNDLMGVLRPFMASPAAGVLSFVVSVLAVALLALAVSGIGLKLYRSINRKSLSVEALALLVAMVVPPFIFGVLMSAAVPSYLLPALVPVVVSVSWLFPEVLSIKGGRTIIGICLALYLTACFLYTVEVRRVLNRFEMTSSLSLKERMAILDELGDLAGDDPFFLGQDGRSINTGIDVAFVYLLYHFGVNEQQVYDPRKADRVFVLWEHRSRVRPQVLVFLQQQPYTRFPRATLFEVPRESIPDWLEVLSQYPAPHR